MSYTTDFKKKAVLTLKALNSVGYAYFNNQRVENVRELVNVLGCSSGSLYAWEKRFNVSEYGTIGYDSDYNESDHEYPKELFQNPIEKQEIQKSVINEIAKETSKKGKDIFGLRFYGWFAKNKGIKNYSRMSINQLKFEVGKVLIQESGIADFKLAIPK